MSCHECFGSYKDEKNCGRCIEKDACLEKATAPKKKATSKKKATAKTAAAELGLEEAAE